MTAFPKPTKRVKQRKPLKRSRMRPGKRKSKHARRERDTAFMLWVKSRPCLARLLMSDDPCMPEIHAHHMGPKKGYRADDATCVPLCSKHHMQWHDANGPFRGWGKDRRREWASWTIAATREAWGLLPLEPWEE